MTAIVGIFDGKHAWVAADGRCMSADVIVSDNTRKVLDYGDWLLGIAGDRRADLAISRMGLPKMSESVHSVSTKIREAVAAAGWQLSGKDNANWRYEVLLAGPSGLYHHCCVGSYIGIERMRPFAVGSGSCYAEAAAWQALRLGASPREACIAGIETAIAYVTSCGGRIFARVTYGAGDLIAETKEVERAEDAAAVV